LIEQESLIMPRKRQTDHNLPSRVYRTQAGSYRLVDQNGTSKVIASKDAKLHQIWAAHEANTNVITMTSLRYLSDQYYKSNNFSVLSERSKVDLRECEKRPIIYFGKFNCSKMSPPDLHRYLTLRFAKATRRANYELTWFRNVFSHAVAIGLHPGPSPAAEIKPFRLNRAAKKAAKDKKRLVSDKDYQAMLAVVPAVGRVAMEVAYCTGCRPGDVLKIHRNDVADGIGIEENKTGHQYSKQITPRLAAAIQDAKTIPGQPFGGWLIRNRSGNQYTVSGWGANWKKWSLLIPESQRFTFQEIRIKAISEAEGNKQEFSMHSNAKMLGIYDKSLRESPSNA
jgi:integrase